MYENYYLVETNGIGQEVHISRQVKINQEAYEPCMIIATRDSEGPIFAGILCGGNNDNFSYLNGVKCLTLLTTSNIKVINGTKTNPLILKSNYSIVFYYFVPLSLKAKMNFDVKIVKV